MNIAADQSSLFLEPETSLPVPSRTSRRGIAFKRLFTFVVLAIFSFVFVLPQGVAFAATGHKLIIVPVQNQNHVPKTTASKVKMATGTASVLLGFIAAGWKYAISLGEAAESVEVTVGIITATITLPEIALLAAGLGVVAGIAALVDYVNN